MNYGTQLKDPRWQRRRLDTMNRDNFTCLICGDNQTTLNVHHKAYRANTSPWDYEDSNLQTLCEHCHACAEILKEDAAVPIICAKQLFPLTEEIITLSVIAENEKGRFLAIYHYSLESKKIIARAKASVIDTDKINELLLLSNKL